MYNLAQVNIAVLRAPLTDPRLHGFVSRLAEINRLAETSPGFVWRLVESDNDEAKRIFPDSRVVVNMTVWKDVDSLKTFTYRSAHRELLGGRHDWFERVDTPYFAMWWIPSGLTPSLQDARNRLDYLGQHGDTAYAFTFRKVFPAPEVTAQNA
ncbi:MAG TPA: DUF3291 domain-containing protein [Bryobacteraceae bacterium]|nr:DUF3291 domain-containing protein [Bryobacteraceae bacterium]